ncbi:ABC transporter permease subunit [Nocardioides sp. dk4132]|uniref:amino acid ABC transporter permease n=1 Tax=unclassified Nocardioides TaxID=2615069 RepID=UPI001296D046|nr:MULTISPECIES: amino acid ABC transporter permease [unclassified Nocardioides]MQW76110.1 ABC transporter permease subunit [Nocardioides sp. dk4132]QGA08955.1 ABC transporter permease subunit [Nocardioides sp. dk884]
MEAVFSNFDEYLKAFGVTLALFVVSGLASLVLGLILASLRVGPVSVMRRAAGLYVTIFRNTPLLMIFVFMAAAMPKLGYNFKWVENIEIAGWSVSAFFVRSTIALTLYTSAFVCEAFRSGVNSVDVGQAEAARAVGLTFFQSMRYVVLPQALRAVVPPLTSVQVALIKNTSVAAAFGMAEATATMRSLTNDYGSQRPEIFLLFAIGYIIIVEAVALSSYALERKWKVA